MEELCGAAFLAALVGLATLVRKLFRFLEERYGDLPPPALHIRLFILPAIATLPLLFIIHFFVSETPAGYLSPAVLVFVVFAFPLVLLSGPWTAFLEKLIPMSAQSLELLAADSLIVLNWILWGQAMAVIIRMRRSNNQSAGGNSRSATLNKVLHGSQATPADVRQRTKLERIIFMPGPSTASIRGHGLAVVLTGLASTTFLVALSRVAFFGDYCSALGSTATEACLQLSSIVAVASCFASLVTISVLGFGLGELITAIPLGELQGTKPLIILVATWIVFVGVLCLLFIQAFSV